MADEIAYRDLQPGEVIQPGDQWQAKDGTGAWHEYHPSMHGLEPLESSIARRPYNITAMSEKAFEQQKLIEAVKRELALARGIAQHWEHVAEQMEAQRDEAQAELACLQQSPPAADHFADADKMVESELERRRGSCIHGLTSMKKEHSGKQNVSSPNATAAALQEATMQADQSDFRNRHAEYMRLDRAMTDLRRQMRSDMRYMLDVFKIEGIGRMEISRRMGRGKTYAGDMCSDRILPPEHAYTVCYPRLLKMFEELPR